MVKRVTAPAEHHLLVNGPSLVSQFGGETLSKFAVGKLLEHKITSRNFKAGLDFFDNYKARTARNKLAQMVVNYVQKEFPGHTYDPYSADTPLQASFVSRHAYSPEQIHITTLYDEAVLRYVRRLNRAMTVLGLPLQMTVSEWNHENLDKIEITIGARATGTRSTLYYYRILCFIPEILKFFQNLSRKACFTDPNAKAIARSKFSGFVGAASNQRNTADSAANANAANSAPQSRRGQPSNRRDASRATGTQYRA